MHQSGLICKKYIESLPGIVRFFTPYGIGPENVVGFGLDRRQSESTIQLQVIFIRSLKKLGPNSSKMASYRRLSAKTF